jgi:hypothetical protein
VFESAIVKACKSDSTVRAESQTLVMTKSWSIATYDLDPCGKRSSFGLAGSDRRNLAIIVVGEDSTDPRIAQNVERLRGAHADDHVLTIKAPNQPGVIDAAIGDFVAANPDAQPENVTLYVHGHQGTVREPAPPPLVGDSDTLLSTKVLPPLADTGVYSTSVKDIAGESLGSLKQRGVLGDETNCMLVVAGCQAGGSVESIAKNDAYWRSMGLDATLGAARADQLSYDSENTDPSLPTETLINKIAEVRTNQATFDRVDTDANGFVTAQELYDSQGPDGLVTNVTSSTTFGVEKFSPGRPDAQTTLDVQQIGRDPNTEEPIYQNNLTTTQNLIFAGDGEAVISARPDAPAYDEESVAGDLGGDGSMTSDLGGDGGLE